MLIARMQVCDGSFSHRARKSLILDIGGSRCRVGVSAAGVFDEADSNVPSALGMSSGSRCPFSGVFCGLFAALACRSCSGSFSCLQSARLTLS